MAKAKVDRNDPKAVALDYARREMGRRVRVAGVLDAGSHSFVLLDARDGDEPFALVLAAAIATHEWAVVEETDVEDYFRNGGRRSSGTESAEEYAIRGRLAR
jgi:hypothetical protein